MPTRSSVFGLAAVLWMLGSTTTYAFTVPANDGFVTNLVGEVVLTASQEETLEQQLQAYRQQTSNEIAVVILQSLGGVPPADAAVQIGRSWGVGTSENDNGILILISYEDHEIFIATGRGLEGAVPDIVAKGIIETDIKPNFRDGKYAEGITAGIDSLEKHNGGEYTAERYAPEESFGDRFFFLIIFTVIACQFLGAFLARTKSWWLGGVFGGVGGLIVAVITSWWLSVPLLVLVGLGFDYWVSKFPQAGRSRRGRWTGGGSGWGGSSGSGGGFGGFSGGSFGGGGAGGRW